MWSCKRGQRRSMACACVGTGARGRTLRTLAEPFRRACARHVPSPLLEPSSPVSLSLLRLRPPHPPSFLPRFSPAPPCFPPRSSRSPLLEGIVEDLGVEERRLVPCVHLHTQTRPFKSADTQKHTDISHHTRTHLIGRTSYTKYVFSREASAAPVFESRVSASSTRYSSS